MSWVRTELTQAEWQAETHSEGHWLSWPATRWVCKTDDQVFTLTCELMDAEHHLSGFGKVMVRQGELKTPFQFHYGRGFWIEPNRADRTLALALEAGWSWLEEEGAPARPEGWAS